MLGVHTSNLGTSRKKFSRISSNKFKKSLTYTSLITFVANIKVCNSGKENGRLKTGKAVIVCDYMMKLLVEKFMEPQRNWFSKKGVSVHGSMFLLKSRDSSDIEMEIHDIVSSGDCTQNWFLKKRNQINCYVVRQWTSLPKYFYYFMA